MSITDELRECPFCGGEADYHIHERIGVECIGCGGGFAAVYTTKHDAAAAWNRRAAIEATLGCEREKVYDDGFNAGMKAALQLLADIQWEED